MKKIVFLLFVCLNLFAQEVYDLRDKTTETAAEWFIYNQNENLNLGKNDLYSLFPKEYEILRNATNAIDFEDGINALNIKAQNLRINPKIGDIIIYGQKEIIAGYHKKFMLMPNEGKVENGQSVIYFFPESRDFAKKMTTENPEKISYEISGIIQEMPREGNRHFVLKNQKISLFDKDNNKIAIKELSVDSRIEMQYK